MFNPFQVFTHPKFGAIRTALYGEKVYFVGKDVANALGYARTDAALKKYVAEKDKMVALVPLNAAVKSAKRRMVVITESGLCSLVRSANTPEAQDFNDWLIGKLSAKTPDIVEVYGVHGYVDNNGTAFLSVEDIARGLGFVHVEEKVSPTSGRKTYESIRWSTINGYRAEFGFLPVKAGEFIPENEFYLLAMKANNEAAKTFQLEVANKILPSIRKTGYYSVSNQPQPVLPAAEMEDNIMARMKKQVAEIVTDLAVVYVLLMSNFTIKIGVTGNLNERIKQIKADTKLDVFRYYSTRYMPREDALKLEAFDVKFSDVCAEF